MKVAEIMTQDAICIPGSAKVAFAVKIMRQRGLRALIVDRRHDEDAYGIVTDTDIIEKVAAFGLDPNKMRVYQIMTKPCIVVNPDLGVEYAARLLIRTGIRCAPVIQEKLLGIISFTDILEKSNFVEQPKEVILEREIEKAVEEARRICQEKGHTSSDCITAWHAVEEIQIEAAHQQAKKLEKTFFEEYCEDYPEAMEAMYDNWCSG
ncbi:MAG: CBS domain-containing protein [Prochloraceae cyanobacterium]|nr:CBS domain-containing protein [Prochloraceae cyanobacterium]